MDTDSPTNPRTLDPVVIEALTEITRVVYRRRGARFQERFRRYHGMADRESRDCAISAFVHLAHAGFDFPPFLVRRWALANGWKRVDAQLLDDYAAGVHAGVRYHHADRFGSHYLEVWRRDAQERDPWVDPGRPWRGGTYLRSE